MSIRRSLKLPITLGVVMIVLVVVLIVGWRRFWAPVPVEVVRVERGTVVEEALRIFMERHPDVQFHAVSDAGPVLNRNFTALAQHGPTWSSARVASGPLSDDDRHERTRPTRRRGTSR